MVIPLTALTGPRSSLVPRRGEPQGQRADAAPEPAAVSDQGEEGTEVLSDKDAGLLVDLTATERAASAEEKRLNKLRVAVRDVVQQMYNDARQDLLCSQQDESEKGVDDHHYLSKIFNLIRDDIDVQEQSRAAQRKVEQRLDLMEKQMKHRRERWDLRQRDMLTEVIRMRADSEARHKQYRILRVSVQRMFDAKREYQRRHQYDEERPELECPEELWLSVEKILREHGEPEHSGVPDGLGSVEGIIAELRSERDDWQDMALRLRSDVANEVKRVQSRTRQDIELRAQQRESRLGAAHRREVEKLETRLTELQRKLLAAEAQSRSRAMRAAAEGRHDSTGVQQQQQQQQQQQSRRAASRHAAKRLVEQRQQRDERLKMTGEDDLSHALVFINEKDETVKQKLNEIRELRRDISVLEEDKRSAQKRLEAMRRSQIEARRRSTLVDSPTLPDRRPRKSTVSGGGEEMVHLQRRCEELEQKVESQEDIIREYEVKYVSMTTAFAEQQRNLVAQSGDGEHAKGLAEALKNVDERQEQAQREFHALIGRQRVELEGRTAALQNEVVRSRGEVCEKAERITALELDLRKAATQVAEAEERAEQSRDELAKMRNELLSAEARLRDFQPPLGGMLEPPAIEARIVDLAARLQAANVELEHIKGSQTQMRTDGTRTDGMRGQLTPQPSHREVPTRGSTPPGSQAPVPEDRDAALNDATVEYLAGLEELSLGMQGQLALGEEREKALEADVGVLLSQLKEHRVDVSRLSLRSKRDLPRESTGPSSTATVRPALTFVAPLTTSPFEGPRTASAQVRSMSISAAAAKALSGLQQTYYASQAGRAISRAGSRSASLANANATPSGAQTPDDARTQQSDAPAESHSGDAPSRQASLPPRPGTASEVAEVMRQFTVTPVSTSRVGSPFRVVGGTEDVVAQCGEEDIASLGRQLRVRKQEAAAREDFIEAQRCAEAISYLEEAVHHQLPQRIDASPLGGPRPPSAGAVAALMEAREEAYLTALEREIDGAPKEGDLHQRSQLMLKKLEVKTRRAAQERRTMLSRVLYLTDHSPLDFPTCPQLRPPTPVQIRVAGDWAEQWIAERRQGSGSPDKAPLHEVTKGRSEGESHHVVVYAPPPPPRSVPPPDSRAPYRTKLRGEGLPSAPGIATLRRSVATQTVWRDTRSTTPTSTPVPVPPATLRVPHARPHTAAGGRVRSYTPLLRSRAAAEPVPPPRRRKLVVSPGMPRQPRRPQSAAVGSRATPPPRASPRPRKPRGASPARMSPEPPTPAPASPRGTKAESAPVTLVITDPLACPPVQSTLWLTRVPAPLKTVCNPYAPPRPQPVDDRRRHDPPPAARIVGYSANPCVVGVAGGVGDAKVPITTFLYPPPPAAVQKQQVRRAEGLASVVAAGLAAADRQQQQAPESVVASPPKGRALPSPSPPPQNPTQPQKVTVPCGSRLSHSPDAADASGVDVAILPEDLRHT
eukprot:TRINITY_DN5188_c0_g1_i1.p1 TRINITY_DN5188_c0_g1~~TRINITY_DN5188_c0_g1_i1.p1  ORF type:complete len:1468 (+),score=504.46 TRINITY_DN5188_c0_g1_i1:65-4468(+)